MPRMKRQSIETRALKRRAARRAKKLLEKEQEMQRLYEESLKMAGNPFFSRTTVTDPSVDIFSPCRSSPTGLSRGVRNDASLVPPIRQTASIFKQPVTVYRSQEGKVKTDFKHGPQEKPKQLFWEKRLERLKACDKDGNELESMELPKVMKSVGPNVSDETSLQSVATALHISSQPITGQTGSRSALDKNPGVFINPEQPLVQAVSIGDEDIKRQEEKVNLARKRLQEAMKDL